MGFRSCRSFWGVHGGGHGPFPSLGSGQSSLLRAKVPGASFIHDTEPSAGAEPGGLSTEGVNPTAPPRPQGPPAMLRQEITPTVLNTTSNPVCQPPPIIPQDKRP